MTDPKNNPRIAESRDEQLVDASEELITGDADDPPLSEEAVQEMLNDSLSEARIYELTAGDWIRKPSVPLPTSFSTKPTSGRGFPNRWTPAAIPE